MDTIREAVSHQGRDPVVVQLGKRLRGLGAGEDEPFMRMGGKYGKRASGQAQGQFGTFLTTLKMPTEQTLYQRNSFLFL